MEGHLMGVAMMCEDYTCNWKCDQRAYKLHMEHCKKFKFYFHQKYLSTPWHGAVDQDWRSKMHVPKCTSQPPDGSVRALLSMPSQSGKGAP